MANFATVDDAIVINVKLMAENRVIERALVLSNKIVDALLWQQAHMILQIVFALLLKRFGDGIEFRLNLSYAPIPCCYLVLNLVECGPGFFVELLILGRLFDFGFVLACVFANALEISGVTLDEFTLHASPWTLVESFVVQGPACREDQQQRADEANRARRSADDRIALRLGFLLYERFNRFRRFCHVR